MERGDPSCGFEEAEEAFRELLERAELPPPDEVVQQRDPDELLFIWHAPKCAVVLELSGDRAVGPAAASEDGSFEVSLMADLRELRPASARLM